MPSAELIEQTQQFWERRIGRPVSRGEAEEIISNVVAFFNLLAGWEKAAGEDGDAGEETR